jgi:hypothetical protein
MDSPDRHKGALVGIVGGECAKRLSPEFTLRFAKVTLINRDNNLNGATIASCVKSK